MPLPAQCAGSWAASARQREVTNARENHADRDAKVGPHHEGGHALRLACCGRANDLAWPGDHGCRDGQDRQCRGGRRRRRPPATRSPGRAGLSGQILAGRDGAGRCAGHRDRLVHFRLQGSDLDLGRGGRGDLIPFRANSVRPHSLCPARWRGRARPVHSWFRRRSQQLAVQHRRTVGIGTGLCARSARPWRIHQGNCQTWFGRSGWRGRGIHGCPEAVVGASHRPLDGRRRGGRRRPPGAKAGAIADLDQSGRPRSGDQCQVYRWFCRV